jgi:hypothetical protein
VEYRVYRSILGGEYVRVDQGDLTVSGTKAFTDHWSPVGVEVSYRVTQWNGALESDPLEGSEMVPNFSAWVGIPGDDSRTLEIPLVESFQVVPFLEQEENRPLGRWSALVVGEEEGSESISFSFTLDPSTRGYLAIIREIGDLVRNGTVDHAFLKSPHGGSYKVALDVPVLDLDRGGYEKVSLRATVIDA